jgi:hypothetical protein
MLTAADAVHTYILAKDGNRPFLIQQAFADNAELRIILNTDAIAFPDETKGRKAIEDLLVRRLNVDYENVFTFCLAEPPESRRRHFACHLLVGMSAKADGRLRVGCGRYDWHFDADGKVQKLVILAEVMKVLPPGELTTIMDWLSALPYPWCSTDRVLAHIPVSAGLGDLKTYLEQAEPIQAGF